MGGIRSANSQGKFVVSQLRSVVTRLRYGQRALWAWWAVATPQHVGDSERRLAQIRAKRHGSNSEENSCYAACCAMNFEVVEGDLLDQDVEAIVNAWNRNIIPWWLLILQGVSRAIKKRGGYAPFRELAMHGPIPLGGAVATGAGALPFKGIIHVAGISMFWRSSERSIRDSARNAVKLAEEKGWTSIAMPMIGAGTGGFGENGALEFTKDELRGLQSSVRVVVVRYVPTKS